jgi:hypothetical protein
MYAQARWNGNPIWGHVNQETLRSLKLNNRMASLALVEAWFGNSVDAAALQWYLRTRQEAVTPEIYVQLMVAQTWNMDVRDLLPKSTCQLWLSTTATIGLSRSKPGVN